jgi:hypothetical protein
MRHRFLRRGKYMDKLKAFALNNDTNQGLLIFFAVLYNVNRCTDETKIRQFSLSSKNKMIF